MMEETGEMHATKIDSVVDTSMFSAVTGLSCSLLFLQVM